MWDNNISKRDAEMMPEGITDIRVGDLVTLSPNLISGDRSWSDVLWKVTGVNDGHVQLQDIREKVRSAYRQNVIVIRHQHKFYIADHFKDAEIEECAATV